jgi:DNA polymerase III epsilon subunit-like protein
MKAQAVHGLTLEYLEENGLDEQEAVVVIANFILKYWGPDNAIMTLGHNVATFDIWFLKRLMRRHGIELRFGNRHVDTSTVGFVNFETYTSDQLFEQLGIVRAEHNALEDAKASLESARIARMVFKSALG